jgi:hypothetical protein
MQTDLHDYLARIAKTIAMTRVSIEFISLVTMPHRFCPHI